MASKAESEEQLGEQAPAGVQAIEVDKQGLQARWRDMSQPDRFAPEEEITPGPEATPEATPRPGVGGIAEVATPAHDIETSERA